MIKYVLLADYASVDQSGKLTLVGVFDKFIRTDVTFSFFVIFKFKEETKKEEGFSLEILNSDNKPFITIEGLIAIEQGGIVSKFDGVKFEDNTNYTLQLSIDKKVVYTEPLQIG